MYRSGSSNFLAIRKEREFKGLFFKNIVHVQRSLFKRPSFRDCILYVKNIWIFAKYTAISGNYVYTNGGVHAQ